MITEYHGGRWIIRTSRWKDIKSAGVWDDQSPINPVCEITTQTEGVNSMWDCKQLCIQYIRDKLENYKGLKRGNKVELNNENTQYTFIQLHPIKPGIALFRVPHSRRIIEESLEHITNDTQS